MLTIINDSFIEQCLDKFDQKDQIDILQEECAELIKACSKVKRLAGRYSFTDPLDNLKEEMTHVLISIEVVARICGITPDDIIGEFLKKAQKYNFKKEEEILK